MRLAPERYHIAEKISPAKHVVAAGELGRDAGSTPAASTLFLFQECDCVRRTSRSNFRTPPPFENIITAPRTFKPLPKRLPGLRHPPSSILHLRPRARFPARPPPPHAFLSQKKPNNPK